MLDRPMQTELRALSANNSVHSSLTLSPIAALIRTSILGIGLGLAHSSSNAATITVNSNLDDGTNCTLRAAIDSINAGVLGNGCLPSSVTGTFGVDDAIDFNMPNNTITLNGSQLLVQSDVTIDGDVSDIVIDGAGKSRVLFLDNSEVTLNSLTITNGSINGSGGGIYAKDGSTTISNSTVSKNSAYGKGGGIFSSNDVEFSISDSEILNNFAYGYQSSGQPGSAIHATGTNTTIDIDRSLFSGNQGASSGASIVIENSANLTINNSKVSQSFGVNLNGFNGIVANSGATIEINSTTISDVYAYFRTAAILASGSTASISITNSSVAGVRSGDSEGVGVLASDGASISVTNSTISGVDNYGATFGVRATTNASINLSSSTVSGIESSYFGATGVDASSGASINITNSTVSGTASYYDATAVATSGTGSSITLSNSTIADTFIYTSRRNFRVSSVSTDVDSSVSVDNSILAGVRNILQPIALDNPYAANCFGNVTVDSNSIVSDASCGEQVVVGDPGIGLLADNGGPTFTHALNADSIAINAANNAICPDIDQRGEPRSDSACDAGAYELQGMTVNTLYYFVPLSNGKAVVVPL